MRKLTQRANRTVVFEGALLQRGGRCGPFSGAECRKGKEEKGERRECGELRVLSLAWCECCKNNQAR
jgi:hypothetical protein